MRQLLYRPLQTLAASIAGLFFALLVVAGTVGWRNLERVERIRRHVTEIDRLEHIGLGFHTLLTEHLEARVVAGGPGDDPSTDALPPVDSRQVTTLGREIEVALQSGNQLDAATPRKLESVHRQLENIGRQPYAVLSEAVDRFHEIIEAETQAERDLLESIEGSTRFELELALGLVAAVMLAATGGILLFRRQVIQPLETLQRLLLGLGSREFRPISTRGADPLLLPVLDNYNRLVERLEVLEEAQRSHTRALEEGIRSASRVLLEQQSHLARAERLAAVGEMSASLAHELRNPLAGIQMALANLRREIPEADHRERLSRVSAELERISRLVRDLLAQARHTPEPSRRVRLKPLVEELLALVRYQVREDIGLVAEIPTNLVWEVPEERLRQTLLNLVLNAAEALGESAGTVTVTMREGADGLEITVADDGPGFPAELLGTGIRPFRSTRAEGTGLGLALVRRFVSELGGEIELGEGERGGATVRLRLPRTSETAAAHADADSRAEEVAR